MNKKRGILTLLLIILSIAFIAFVIIMQRNFVNPDFADAEPITNVDQTEEIKSDTDKKDEIEDKSEKKEQEEKDTSTTKFVTVDLLNVRSEPDSDSDIIGVVTLNQEVTAENMEDSQDWVKITTDSFTGYVNGKYLED